MLLKYFISGEVGQGAVCATNWIGGYYHVAVFPKADQSFHSNRVTDVGGIEEWQVSGASCAEYATDIGQIILACPMHDGVILRIVGYRTDSETDDCCCDTMSILVQLELTLRIFTDSWTLNPYAYLIFLVSRSCFRFLISCQSLHQREPRTTSTSLVAIQETLALHRSIRLLTILFSIDPVVIKSIVSFRGGLSSEYQQVVRNQRTPLVIVQIVLDLVTPSPF